MSDQPFVDREERQMALDTSRSFAVQAPAGSGKTELLSLRFLRLLAQASAPEEILAITFTRKAANEMVNRIFETLEWAAGLAATGADTEFKSQLEQDKYNTATLVLQQDKANDWQLMSNPTRLCVQTIDSFCNRLATQLPLHSKLGGNPRISDRPDHCYEEAVTNTLELLNSEEQIATSISVLLEHFDNDHSRVANALLSLLLKRDQWLPFIFEVGKAPESARRILDRHLQNLIEDFLADFRQELSPFEDILCELADYAAENLQHKEQESKLNLWLERKHLPSTSIDDLQLWQALGDLLLTKTSLQWRKARGLNARTGFPASKTKAGKELNELRKSQFAALIAEFELQPQLLEMFEHLRELPTDGYVATQWSILESLVELLPVLTAQLCLSFARHNLVDHSQVVQAAIDALGPDQDPTDLALILDYRIQHILVDEFQDTSNIQNLLLEKLTSGWQPGDGRTVFIVGDGMQSCYSFRNANVGLFIAARTAGIGSVPLDSLDLSTNFRSNHGVVKWINSVFDTAFPLEDNIAQGAVSYTKAEAYNSRLPENPIQLRILEFEEHAGSKYMHQKEAEEVVTHIRKIRLQEPTSSIAILVRARRHLQHITNALRSAEINWLASDVDNLGELPLITDLLSLTRALHNTADRLAWLAILRAPWCGLDASDLLAIARYTLDLPVNCALQNQAEIPNLSPAGSRRLSHFADIINYVMAYRSRRPLSQLVDSAWYLLRAPALVLSSRDESAYSQFMELLRQHEDLAGKLDLDRFSKTVGECYVSGTVANSAEHPVQLMTIHKAKGLEFDHVIIPGLAQQARAEQKDLLIWHEHVNSVGNSQLLLATRGATGANEDGVYGLLRYEQSKRRQFETTRLMYIAITRARESVLMLATGEAASKTFPAPNSLLATIWDHVVENQYTPVETITIISSDPTRPGAVADEKTNRIRRFASPPELSVIEKSFITGISAESLENNSSPIESLSTNSVERWQSITGTLIHETLQNYSSIGPTLLAKPAIENIKLYWHRVLRNLVDADQLEEIINFITNSVANTVGHPELSWIFDSAARESESELGIAARATAGAQNYRIDRTLLDKDGIRWIIDYKTASKPDHQTLDQFLTAQSIQHRSQLQRYRRLFNTMELQQTQIKTALLFTALPKLVEVE